MPRESSAAKSARTEQIIAILKNAYPNAHCELNFTTPLELLVATILSAQCTDKQVNIVTQDLFKKYRSAADYAAAPVEDLQQDIRRIGFFRNKARNIKACCQLLLEKHGGEVPNTMEQLTELAGVGRKTANVVLGNVFNVNIGVVVDTHVARLSERLNFTREKSPEKIEQDLMKLLPQNDWCLFSHLLIWHGRRRCYARNPDCVNCELKALCPTGEKRLSATISKEAIRVGIKTRKLKQAVPSK
ncbi:MAG: endonuclease III [Verrucomicrobia bacterium]|nr:endonuclease III [Verrucomicrobiota bacterium]